jgi:hypothetical protein
MQECWSSHFEDLLHVQPPIVPFSISQVGSHYHFVETNPYLVFDRAAAYGMRLNIAAGTAVRFEVRAISRVWNKYRLSFQAYEIVLEARR